MGGESLYFGKPHPPIYDLARRRLLQIGQPVPDTASSPSATASSPTSRAGWARTSTRSSSPAASRARKPGPPPRNKIATRLARDWHFVTFRIAESPDIGVSARHARGDADMLDNITTGTIVIEDLEIGMKRSLAEARHRP
jgi:hypothetical protein